MSGYIDVYSRIGEGRPHESRSAEEALCEMDEFGIERAWIYPTDAFAAVRNREGNDLLAKTVTAHPDRFIGAAAANPWFGDDATTELRRAFEMGLRVLYLHPPVQGFNLSDRLADPLVELAIGSGAPIYAHTATPICAMPFQLAALAARHPRGRFIMGHTGYSDFWPDAASAAGAADNIWIETSYIDPDIVADAVEKLGAERLLFGTSAPLASAGAEIRKITDLPLPDDALDKIMRTNAAGMLP